MTVLVVQHKVRDFDAWKLVFDEDESRRREHGAQRHWVYRTVEDPDDVVVAQRGVRAAPDAGVLDRRSVRVPATRMRSFARRLVRPRRPR
jgi:hypothetical protein